MAIFYHDLFFSRRNDGKGNGLSTNYNNNIFFIVVKQIYILRYDWFDYSM